MPLGNTDALGEWVETDNPSDRLWRQVVLVILDLSETPWLAPSIPLHGGSGEVSETREIPLTDLGVTIFYEHRHSDGLVDLHYIATELG